LLALQALIKMASSVKDGPDKNLEAACVAYQLALHRLLASPAPRHDQVAHVGGYALGELALLEFLSRADDPAPVCYFLHINKMAGLRAACVSSSEQNC
jgi:hypothetical protein